jgi:hypothetical protein
MNKIIEFFCSNNNPKFNIIKYLIINTINIIVYILVFINVILYNINNYSAVIIYLSIGLLKIYNIFLNLNFLIKFTLESFNRLLNYITITFIVYFFINITNLAILNWNKYYFLYFIYHIATDLVEIYLFKFTSNLFQTEFNFSINTQQQSTNLIQNDKKISSIEIIINDNIPIETYICKDHLTLNLESEIDIECQNCICTICLSNMNNLIVYRLKCNHNFHKECLINFIKNKNINVQCPNCRQSINF